MKAREEMKNITKRYLQESELLKLKMAQQHQIDIQQVGSIYGNQIETLTIRIDQLEKTNADLRAKYEDEIRSRQDMKHKYEIDISNLKNMVKKLKIQIGRVGDEFRLSIEGIRSSNMAMSSQLIVQIQDRKAKEGFFEIELKKLRQHL